jgi:transcription elongation factor Elf1
MKCPICSEEKIRIIGILANTCKQVLVCDKCDVVSILKIPRLYPIYDLLEIALCEKKLEE